MAEDKKYIIKVQGVPVEVSKDVYLAYYQMDRHARFLEEKDSRNGKTLYSALDTDSMLGEDLIHDPDGINAEESAITKILKEQLHTCIDLLSDPEKSLVRALYFDGKSEREYAKTIGLSQKGVNKRKQKVLKKLRKLMGA